MVNAIESDFMTLLKDHWFYMENWKWIGLLTASILGFLLQRLLLSVLQTAKRLIRRQFKHDSWSAFTADQPIHRPLSWILVSLFWIVTLNAISPPEGLRDLLRVGAQLILSLSLIRLAYMAVESLGHMLNAFAKKTSNTMDDHLVPFATRTLKVLVVAMGILVALQNFGFNVVSLLAGLGIGGLALAFGAQETTANVFGSITILLDRPFQVGDWIKVGSTEGVVEEVGFRSTRIRTFYNSVITVPNASMAKETIDNYQIRPARRIRHVIGLTYDSTQAQIENFITLVSARINAHPEVIKENTTVTFNELGSFSLNVLVNFHANLAQTSDELKLQQEVLFEIMQAAKQVGVQFAFPTQTLYHLMPPADPATPQAPRPS